MEYYWLNIGSLILGLLAWVLPLLAIARFNKSKDVQGNYMVYCGLVSAISSLLCVITYRHHLINIEDWSALMDTTGAFQLGAVSMSVVAIVLNGFALGYKNKK